MSEAILALDFGGTKLTAAVTTLSDISEGTVPNRTFDSARRSKRWRGLRQAVSPSGAGAQYELMVRFAAELLAGARPAAIGVSFGGPVDASSGQVRLSHHVSGWENTPLRQRLETEFGAPVSVDNDANAAAFGEYRFGAGRGYHHLMYVTVSTGVGGGWILDGRLWRGHEGMAGEIGHMVVDPAGPVCLCGKRGCVERLASGPFMAQDLRAIWLKDQGRKMIREGESASETDVTGKTVAEAAAAGDESARAILIRGAEALGVGIGNTANLINPQLFVLGGGVTKSGREWWATVRRAACSTALPEVHFEIVAAALGDQAPLWGAMAMAADIIKRSDGF